MHARHGRSAFSRLGQLLMSILLFVLLCVQYTEPA